MDKYERLRKKKTDAGNYDLGTEDIIARLKQWDEKYGVELSDVVRDAVTVKFQKLPDDLDALANEIYEFCPDTIDQHFGCFHEMINGLEEMEQEIPEAVQELVAGVDLEDENYGLELLKRSLRKHQTVALWWD